jgi:hypothetical protein
MLLAVILACVSLFFHTQAQRAQLLAPWDAFAKPLTMARARVASAQAFARSLRFIFD